MNEVIQIRHFFCNFLSPWLFGGLFAGWVFASFSGASVFADVDTTAISSMPAPSSDEQRPSFLDIRVRPIAALQATPGVELGGMLTRRFELGPTIHYFSGTNDVADTTLRTFEIGIKGTWILCQTDPFEGVYLSGAFYDYINNVVDNSIHPSYSTGTFSTLGYTFTTGFQWDLGILHSSAWTVRLGGGIGYGQEHFQSVSTQGRRTLISTNVGVLSQLEPTMEFTVGFRI